MSLITISDLPSSTELDHHDMSAIRGGHSWGTPDVKLVLNVHQQVNQRQEIAINTLNNNGTIGAGFVGPHISLEAIQKGSNTLVLPDFAS